jgi:S-adenosylmethionine:tRNA ribosyltransferase-isomerase
LRIEQLDYELPAELIAQQPVEPRDQSRLMVVDRKTGSIAHRRFAELPELLDPRDCLVLNDTRVLPARLVGRRAATGGRWEGLFLRELESGLWELMCQTGGRPRSGEMIQLDSGDGRLVLCDRTPEGHWRVRPDPPQPALEFLAGHGHVPLPPYIRRQGEEASDRDRYQTVYARRPGAVAAPTAGLHFTPQLMEHLTGRGVEIVWLTLHVGPGTFLPIRESVDEHVMQPERGELSSEAVERIWQRRQAGGRVVAVGSTSMRVLETAACAGELRPWRGETALFIRPGHAFQVVDALITNFHLPRTTLLALVYAFAGEQLCRRAYALALQERYRFYSFGDAMLIL